MGNERIAGAGMPRRRIDVAREIAALRDVVTETIVPGFLVRVLDPERGGPYAPDRFHFEVFNGPLEEATGFGGGLRLDELLAPRAAETVAANYADAIERGGTISYLEDVQTPSGAAAWRTTLQAKRMPDGTVFAILGCTADVTRARERELADAERIAKLTRMATELRVFSSMAAHDVRSPLATIESLAMLIKEGFVDAGDGKIELIEHLAEIARTARAHMDELLDHSMAFADTAASEAEVDFGHVCRDLIAITDPEAKLEIAYPDADLMCDRVALHLLLRNLLSNAGKHSAGRIEIALGPVEGAPHLRRFTVSDDGPGFPDGFDPFDVDDETRARSAHGFGLSAVRYVAETRGGTVSVVPSAFGRGAAVAFTLPAREAGAAAAESAA